MNGGRASAIYHDKATRTGSIPRHITHSISADLADCCALPLTLPPCQIMDPSHIHLNVLTISHKFTSFTVIYIFIRLPWLNIHSNVVTSDILTSYSFTISTLIRLIKKIVPVTLHRKQILYAIARVIL